MVTDQKAGKKPGSRLRRWYLRAIDEAPNPKTQLFLDDWARKEWTQPWGRGAKETEPTEALIVRHETIIRNFERLDGERRTSVQSVFQMTSLTLTLLSLIGLGVALGTKSITLTPKTFGVIAYLMLIVMLLLGSYMPNPVKALVPFMDAGEFMAKYGVAYPKDANGKRPKEEYYGELSLRSYALHLIYDQNVRNKILRRWRLLLGMAFVLIVLGGIGLLAYLAARTF